jgi:hypothetical protein
MVGWAEEGEGRLCFRTNPAKRAEEIVRGPGVGIPWPCYPLYLPTNICTSHVPSTPEGWCSPEWLKVMFRFAQKPLVSYTGPYRPLGTTPTTENVRYVFPVATNKGFN